MKQKIDEMAASRNWFSLGDHGAGRVAITVLILAIMSCTSRRQQAANNAKKNSNKDGNHSPKINLEEAW
ncbi:hypothetical protein E2C01_066769 [Portunus trituberculatus]|uniref:Uncharacterized protein n=1 Tax=Portunus trituberculatus TaxID=210409 RepID=A0A5B7HMF5_PORTR|nr:hypothetical protein [Portunus trituberculatus]